MTRHQRRVGRLATLLPETMAAATGRALVWRARLLFRLRGGTTLAAMPTPGVAAAAIVVTCLHKPGCWSYCTGGYRYCLCCQKVRVRC